MDHEETLSFSADVARLLEIVAHALYSNKEVFLRELISNAADACDRLRYDALENPALSAGDSDFKIHVTKDTDARTVTVRDNGIGMTRDELVENLGTIAKSGTRALMEQAAQAKDSKDKLSLIGQFGVGFYAGFMVADKIAVISQKAGDSQAWHWESDGRSGFTIREATKDESEKLAGTHGTAIVLHINDDSSEYLIDQKLEEVIKTYSDHIGFPIYLGDFPEPVNRAGALWMRPKNEITTEDYDAFYKHIGHGMDEPLATHHWHAEGKIEYTALLFTPTLRPWDLYDPGRKHAVRLYVKRVFISDDCDGLMYPWLRFLRGVIDSEDLPLNISREMLQHNPVIAKIRSGVAKRILSDLDRLSRDNDVDFTNFWNQFGAVLKEGLYDAPEHREAILKVTRFFSTHEENKLTSLADYAERMKDGQDAIYYISGENMENLKNSPQLEGFKARGLEVLFFTDTIDDFWLQNVSDFDGKPFKSITKGNIDLDRFENQKDKEKQEDAGDSESTDLAPLIEKMKTILSEDVGEVRVSKRLTDSPVCLVAADGSVDMHMERVLKIHQSYTPQSKRVLEINGKHPLIKKIASLTTCHSDPRESGAEESKDPSLSSQDDMIEDATYLLLDQAKIIQGEPVSNPSRFARSIAAFMERGLQ
ncbi:MAG: molecular chaperone HtpG [Rhodospirillales bacterium]|nr:molecular chaperone HtpG [Rhodospirillales bacterium]